MKFTAALVALFAVATLASPPALAATLISGTPPASVSVGETYGFTPTASSTNGAIVTFRIRGKPSWASFDWRTGELRGTPTAAQVGTYRNIRISAYAERSTAALPTFSIRVVAASGTPAPNHAPVIGGTPGTAATVGAAWSFQPAASDADSDPLTFIIQNKPAWASFSKSSGRLSGTPTAAGTFAGIVISVSDGKVSTALPAFTLTVSVPPPANSAPTISGVAPASATAGSAYSFQPSASDANGDVLSFAITNRPAWASFSTSTGRLSGTPGTSNIATFSNIVISVSDGKASAALPAFFIQVQAPANRAPTISGAPATSATVGSAYSFQPAAADADGDALTFSIANQPAWASFSASTGRLSGTPAATGSTAGIVISVSDGKASTALPAFTLTVAAKPNGTPSISGTPATTVNVGAAYSFTPSASDPDGDTIAFGIANKPAWASFDTTTGKLAGTPAAADVGTTVNVVISVSDGKGGNATLPAFSIKVHSISTGSATLSWTAPTENEDGTVLTNLAGYRIQYGTSASALTQTVQVANPGLTTYVIDGLTQGTWYFAMRAYTSTGLESAPTNVVSKTIQ